MILRWLIRSFFIVVLLLCAGIWAGSYWWGAIIYSTHAPEPIQIVRGTVGFYWSKGGSVFEFQISRVLPGQASLFEVEGQHFLGFGWGEHKANEDIPGWTLPPTYFRYASFPLWFPTLISALLLLLVWRKTRIPTKGRAFPIDVAPKENSP